MTSAQNASQAEGLLAKDEPPAYEVVNATGAGSAVLVCDHASNRMPRRLKGLGLGPADRADHIAWDPGAAEVAQYLSQHLDATLVSSGYSRLVIDCNRPLDNPESVPEQSAGVRIPGNEGISPQDRTTRIYTLFRPYHQAISALLDRRAADGRPSLLLSIHSFTPLLDGQWRPWQVACSNGRDRRLTALMLDALAGDPSITVGDNQPYTVEDAYDYTIPVHGQARGLPHVLIEIRQDQIRTLVDAAHWAERLAATFRGIEPEMLQLSTPS